MTARRIAAVATRVALGGAVLAAVVGAVWAVGSIFSPPEAWFIERVVGGVAIVALGGAAAIVAVWAGQLAHDIGDAIVDAWQERRR